MDDTILKKLEQKIEETISKKDEINQLINSLSDVDNSDSFVLGILVGRIYNSFYYQTKRILNREPTETEYQEFLEFVNSKKSKLENLW